MCDNTMRLQDIASYLVVLLPFAATDSLINEGVRFKQTNCAGTQDTASPVEYLKTPNFDVFFLREENSNPIWRKFADLFQPIDIRNAKRIEVSYGSNTLSNADAFSLNRFELESVLAMLGGKRHIIVLRPRNCNPHYTRRVIEKSLMSEFKNEFLHKLLQQLDEKTSTKQMGSDMIDPFINRILEVLDEGDKRMIDDVKRKFELKSPSEKRIYSSSRTAAKENSPGTNKYEDPCSESYVFFLQNQENLTDPKALNDLLLRILRVVTESH